MEGMIKEKAMEKVVEGVISLLSLGKSELSRIRNVESNLEKLDDTRLRIDALLSDAEQRRFIEDDAVHRWLSDLKALSFDAQDLLDEFNALRIINHPDPNPNPNPRKRKWVTFSASKKIADQIDRLKERYDDISNDRKNLRFRQGESTRRIRNSLPFQESSVRDDAPVHGRGTERDEIIGVLTSSSDGNCGHLQVVCVTGCGGIGKTALARLVFDDDAVKQHFDLRIWVGLSQGFDVTMTTKKIIESSSLENGECCISSLDFLQYRLRDILAKKRFLIVLDNVWNEELDFWWRLRAPMVGSGVDGSRVLVTTRSKRVSRNMQAMRSFCLKGLSVGDSWSIFCEKVFPRGDGSQILKDNSNLKEIGLQIMNKCQGSPILVKSMAIPLYSVMDEYNWKCVLDDMPEHTDASDVVLRTLRVSYDHLPLHLKRCFSFLSIFPVGYEFDKNELVKLWMALGFIKPRGRRRVEDIGDKYFTDLLSLSVFQSSDSHHSKDRQRYKMSSLIHDLAKSVSIPECRVISDGVFLPDDIKMARYILLAQYNQKPISFEKIFDSRGLRALILDGKGGFFTNQILSKLFEKLRYLRVLDLSNSQLEELPESIDKLILLQYLNLTGTEIMTLPESVGYLYNLQTLELRECHELIELPDSIRNMKQLRYLGLYGTEIESLPESVSGLYNLQTLELGMCKKLTELPNDISSLVNLRCLDLQIDWKDWDGKANLISMPLGIGGLTSLETLSRFVVGKANERGIGVLKNLNLRGELCISNLENVLDPLYAEEANLIGKKYIDSLMLRWSDGITENKCAEQVIGSLRPHQNLKHLWIANYRGGQFPSWMQDYSLAKLETLSLVNCTRCKTIPNIGNFGNLKALHIDGLHNVVRMDDVFPNSNDANYEGNVDDMAQFSKRSFSNCSRLENLQFLPLTLENLEIRNCPKLNWEALPMLPKLRALVVGGGNEKTMKWIEQLSTLSSLTISQFSIDKFIPKFLSLEYLEVSFCPKLSSISGAGLPSTLKELKLSSCESLSSLTSLLDTSSFLHRLEILNVPRLTSLTAIPDNLQYLTISGCPTLQQRCCEGGEDWPLIQKICFKSIESCSPSWFKKFYMAIRNRI